MATAHNSITNTGCNNKTGNVVRGARCMRKPLSTSQLIQRKCACGSTNASLMGACSDCKKKQLLGANVGLSISSPDEAHEKEADRVADSIMDTSTPGVGASSVDLSAKFPTISRSAGSNGTDIGVAAPKSVQDVVSSAGQPLDSAVRLDMEARFGRDFGAVKIYNDAKAAESAASIDAQAYTVGQKIVFGSGEYAPSTVGGRKLLAHELTHTIQNQRNSDSARVSRKGGTFGGFFRNIGRAIADFFTGSEPAYEDEELRNYLKVLSTTREIEGDYDSDNKARAVVSRQLRFKPQLADTQIKVLLVEEMLDGPTLGDDERAIINLLRTSTLNESGRIVQTVGRERLWDNFSGKNRRALEAITLTGADFKNTAEVERLKGLSPKKLTEYRDNARDPAVKAQIVKILHMQNITTPLSIDVNFDNAGVATFTSNGAKITVKPDIVSNDSKMGSGAHTQILTQGSPIENIVASGNSIVSFTGGQTSFIIQTVYGPDAKKAGLSKYGRGTTAADKAAGNTSLQFHESRHGQDFLQFIKDNPPPKFKGKAGMSITDFNKASGQYRKDVTAYGNKISEYSIRKSDCVGTPISGSELKEVGMVANFCSTK